MGPFGPAIGLDLGTNVVLLDNATPFVYDTMVLNTSNGTQQIIRLSNSSSLNRQIRGNTNTTYQELYLANIFDCPYATLVNGTQSLRMGEKAEGQIGEFFASDRWYAPLRVFRGTAPVSANLTILGYASKDLEGITSGALPAANHTTSGTTTNGGGIGFVRTNITVVGRYSAIWAVNTSSEGVTISDRAKTRSDGQTNGGGQGPRVEIINLRMCHQMGQQNKFGATDSNVSMTCGIRDRRYTLVGGVNLTVNLIAYNNMGQEIRTLAKLFNSTGDVVTKVPTRSDGFDTGLNFTHPTGWPCNQEFRLEGNATNGSITQFFHIGSGKRECGVG